MRTENDIYLEKRIKINKLVKCNRCHHFPILPLLGVNHRLPILNMYKNFVYINNTEDLNNEFVIAYMVNPKLHVNSDIYIDRKYLDFF